MLVSLRSQGIIYDLPGLAADSLVTVGRAGNSSIRLDAPEVPFLVSRKHATVTLQSDGQVRSSVPNEQQAPVSG